WTWVRERSACARAVSSSPDLSWRARLALAAALVITAASLPRLAAVRQLAGGTAVPLAAGVCALVALLAARLPLGFSWGPAGSHRPAPEVARGFAAAGSTAHRGAATSRPALRLRRRVRVLPRGGRDGGVRDRRARVPACARRFAGFRRYWRAGAHGGRVRTVARRPAGIRWCAAGELAGHRIGWIRGRVCVRALGLAHG